MLSARGAGGPCETASALDYYGLPFGPALRSAVVADPSPEITVSRDGAFSVYGDPIVRDSVLGWNGGGARPLNTTRVASAVQTYMNLNGDSSATDKVTGWEKKFGDVMQGYTLPDGLTLTYFSDDLLNADVRRLAPVLCLDMCRDSSSVCQICQR